MQQVGEARRSFDPRIKDANHERTFSRPSSSAAQEWSDPDDMVTMLSPVPMSTVDSPAPISPGYFPLA